MIGAERIFKETRVAVADRGHAPSAFLNEMVEWGRTAPEEIFAPNSCPADIYASVKAELGPWESPLHRRAVMLEVLRVLAGFESSWNWNEGRDTNNPGSVLPETTEAGAWQVSANSMFFGPELRSLILTEVGNTDGHAFQRAMKESHTLAMEYTARLLRRTVRHNGPALRKEINPWLRRAAVAEFQAFLA